jgi:putative transposase
MGLAIPYLVRLALDAGHREARDGRGLASQGFRLFWTWKVRHRQPGRPVISRGVRDLIRKMCRENPGWGAPRIHGELLKLGIDIGESSVSKYLVRSRKPPSQTWRTFLENHLTQLVSMDFFTVPVPTAQG